MVAESLVSKSNVNVLLVPSLGHDTRWGGDSRWFRIDYLERNNFISTGVKAH